MRVGGFKMVFGNLFVIGTCSDMINGKHWMIIELRKYLHRTFCQLHVLEYRRSEIASGKITGLCFIFQPKTHFEESFYQT